MVPTLFTSQLPSAVNQIALVQLILIITLLPFSFQSNIKDSQLVIYSNGPCLIVRFFESELGADSNPSFPTLRPLEVPLRIAGKNCSQNDPGWITSIDYYIEPVTLDFYLIWADSYSQTLWTGRVNSTNYHISDVKQLRDNNSNPIGSRVRSLIVHSGKLFISLPYSHRVEMYDLIGGLSAAQKNPQSPIINLNRTVLLDGKNKIGKILYNQNADKLFWIEENKCLWFGTPGSLGIENKKFLLCYDHPSDEVIYSAVIDPDSGDIFVFYEKGKIERLSGPDWSQRSTVIANSLAGEKYNEAKFYTIEVMKEKQFLKFYASDTQHYAFRKISLIKRFKEGQNDEGDSDEYILDKHNSGIVFTDAPNIYDFIFPDAKQTTNKLMSRPRSQNDKKTVGIKDENLLITEIVPSSAPKTSNQQQDDELQVTKIARTSDFDSFGFVTERLPSLIQHQSRIKSMLEPIKVNLDQSNLKTISKLESSPEDNLDTINPLSKMIVSAPSSSPPVERLPPPQITILTVTSSSTIMYWLYAFLMIGIVILCLWLLATLIGWQRNYQKIYSDDNSLKENLTSVKY